MQMSLRHVVTVAVAIAAVGWATQAIAQAEPCPSGQPRSAAGICPIVVPGDPGCDEVVDICKITQAQAQIPGTQNTEAGEISITPPGSGTVTRSTTFGNFAIRITVNADGTLKVRDESPVSQQNGTKGYEISIIRRNGANVYCGTSILVDDKLKGPGTGTPSQATICWAQGPCLLPQTGVDQACATYNSTSTTPRPADFLQAYQIGPVEQRVNVCGCPPSRADFCNPGTAPTIGGESAFVSCNPNNAPLKASEAISTSTEGTGTCIWMTIGGRRMLVDKDGTDPNC